MSFSVISDREFENFRAFIYQNAGITLSPVKKALVSGRLGKRLRFYELGSFAEYYDLIQDSENSAELQVAIDLLTTNETYFFREPKHFEFLKSHILPERKPGEAFRVWSAACSTGAEAYSTAMVLADELGFDQPWEIFGTDISTRVLEQAIRGLYPIGEAGNISKDYLRRFCLKGVRSQEGMMLIDKRLRKQVSFQHLNLIGNWPNIGKFDLIFLRNVMIYFDMDVKRKIVNRLVNCLSPGGYLLVGHSETLNGISDRFDNIRPSIYRLKP